MFEDQNRKVHWQGWTYIKNRPDGRIVDCFDKEEKSYLRTWGTCTRGSKEDRRAPGQKQV